MADKLLNDIDDFELPPLPKKPPVPPSSEGSDAPKADAPAPVKKPALSLDMDDELPPLKKPAPAAKADLGDDLPPLKKPAPAAKADTGDDLPPLKKPAPAAKADIGDDLPPLKKPAPAAKADQGDDLPPLKKPAPPVPDAADIIDGLPPIKKPAPSVKELPPMPAAMAKKEQPGDKPSKANENKRSPEDDRFDFEPTEVIDYDNMDEEALKKLEKSMVSMNTKKDAASRNKREQEKMDDLSAELGNAPVLDDLSDKYVAPQKKADDLMERDQLGNDEKLILKQRLEEDLGHRPKDFNARASKRMYNKLMEEKTLKIAKKGFGLSLIVIVMGLVSSAISYLFMNWEGNEWFHYVAYFGLAASLLLFIKSNHTKMFSIIISAMTLIMYVGPGLFLYALEMQGAPDYIVHIVCGTAASVLNIASIIMLTKNEAIKTYYSTSFSKK